MLSVSYQEQCNGRTALHLAVDLQNLELVKLLVGRGADVNSLTYGGHTAYHLTYGRQGAEIQQFLYDLTAQNLRELPDSESEVDSEDDDYEYDVMSDEEVCNVSVLFAQWSPNTRLVSGELVTTGCSNDSMSSSLCF